MGSMVRSFLFIAAAAVVAGLGIKGRFRPLLVTVIIGGLAFIDLMGIDLQYLSADNYRDTEEVRVPFKPTQADQQILQDKGYYRVFDLREGLQTLTYGALGTAYFHRAIGGYHPAKLSIYEDLIEHQLYKFPDCQPVIDMLNTRYLIEPAGQGGDSVVVEPERLRCSVVRTGGAVPAGAAGGDGGIDGAGYEGYGNRVRGGQGAGWDCPCRGGRND